jgi:arylsulfatase
VLHIFDLWLDPQERSDIFINNCMERTWTLVTIHDAVYEKMKTYVKYPPRKLQSEGYAGPIKLTEYQRLKYVRDLLEKEGFKLTLPTGN